MENVERLGYYAKDKDGDLFRFQWDNSTFKILVDNQWSITDPDNYEILEIGYFVSE